ncbi:hypothetical protein NAV11_20255 [Pseudomonas songnenensis]|uniref:hypothetical protein n=1 Tax=Pseudomonas songnenensis TaxID=1176259 RepID=UPI001ABF8CDA|nr:hypothetical protein [Pseudomonas songnenensis]MCQ4302253.1 hypothetical protein [Pseudomonas songnenensis]
MLIDNHAIAQGEALRAELDLSAKIAAYEAEFGPVQTLPIRTDDKRVPYRISCPEKKKADKDKARSKLVEQRSRERQRSSERISAMLKIGVSPRIIAERIGIAERSVRRIMAEDGITP